MQSPTSRAPAFLALTDDREIVLRSANPASHPSTLSPIRCRLRPSVQSSANTNFPYLREPHGAMFSYPVCRACYVNLPPAACRVDDLHAALMRQTSPFHLHQDRGRATSEVGRLCLSAIAHVSLAQNSSVSLTIERWCCDRLILPAQPG